MQAREAPPRPGVLHRAAAASTLALAAVPALHLLGPDRAATSLLPLLLGLLIGLPHGAVDHLVPAWVSVRARPPRARLLLLAGYAGAAAAALGVVLAAPLPMFLAFLGLTVVHFGTGDVAFLAERDGRRPRFAVHRVLALGGPPVVLPLVLHAPTVDPLLDAVAPGAAAALGPGIRGAALGLLLVAVLLAAVGDLRAGRRRDAGALALLVGVFAVAPPLLAFGAYFGAWHALRHTARLLLADPANAGDLAAGRLGAPLRRFARAAAVPTAAALAGLALLAALGSAEILPAAFAVLIALTIPHMALVAWWDRRTDAGALAIRS
jgi:Brp/Blh family beta-carotene 15,15'-monooxygenase